ncbi:MAG: T9SS type A sorting domain-containing protein [Bacteroidales bacterium]|nr:T9SS type A sorting domain-containing protein [Bacteroidales bacterium]
MQNYTCATNKVARRTVTVSGQSTLTINEGVSLDMYGTDVHECKLLIEANSSLVIGDNAVITAKRGDCEIVVDGNVQIGQGVTFKAEKSATLTITINGQQTVIIDGCTFANVTLQANIGTNRTAPSINASSFSAVNCTFSASESQCEYAMRVEGYSNIMIADNTLSGTGSMSSRFYTDGILLYNCGTSGICSQILRNTIKGCTETGLTLYGTTADIKGKNEITQCGRGVKLINGSTVNNFTGNCGASNAGLTQHIHDNDYCEVSVYRGCLPQTFRFNCITNSGDGWFFEYEDNVDNGKGLCSRIDLENNTWGNYNNTQIESRFNYVTNTNNGVVFDFLPKWDYGYCLSSCNEEAQRKSEEADSLWGIGLYASAKTSYRDIVTLYPNTNSAINALKKLLLIEGADGENYADLQYYYLNDTTIQGNESLSAMASSLSNKCDELREHYEQAIAWYEAVIENEETPYNDSIFATIDLGNLYLRMEANGTKGVKGKLAQFVPKSAEAFVKQTDEALRKLKTFPRRLNPVRELPDQYWTDLVTEQPEGYVVDGNGDVHLYSAEALAWLCSVTNGLNGQEADDFERRTINLEENIDLSEALWIPIAGKNTIIDGFKGNFDGKEHVIDGLTMTNGISNYWAMGLFGKTSEATLSNIILKNGYYEAQSQFNSEGGFLANKVHKSTIEHCFVECEMHIHEGMSPFVYLCDSSTIYNCLVHVPLYRSDGWCTAIPGVFAAMSYPTSHIYNCASIIEQMDWSEHCGLIGMFNHGIIENSYVYIHEILNFPGYGGGSGLGPRNGITGSNMGEVYNCYYNRIRNFDPAFSGYYMQLDDSPGEGDNYYNTSPFAEEGRGHWKLTEEIAFALEGGMVTTNDLLDALNFKVEELNGEQLLSWCDTGMSFENQLLPVFCDFDVTTTEENQNDSSHVSLSPNPTNGSVHIEGVIANEVQVYNTFGQLLKTAKNTKEISLRGLPQGAYLLRITDENGATTTQKIVVK